MGTLLIRRRRPIGEPAGAGRVIHALAGLGLTLDAVTHLPLDPDLPPAELDAVDLNGRFETVILGSHLVNTADVAARGALLRLAARHLAPGGTLLVEHHPLDWASTAAAVRPTPGGSDLGMVDVRLEPPFVSAVSVYDVGGRVVRQPFRAQVLSDDELDAALIAAGLRRTRRLSQTLLEAGRD